jgi:hypothetical protein
MVPYKTTKPELTIRVDERPQKILCIKWAWAETSTYYCWILLLKRCLWIKRWQVDQ